MDGPYVLVALDAVSFEKPYAHKMEGRGKVRKATPPGSLVSDSFLSAGTSPVWKGSPLVVTLKLLPAPNS